MTKSNRLAALPRAEQTHGLTSEQTAQPPVAPRTRAFLAGVPNAAHRVWGLLPAPQAQGAACWGARLELPRSMGRSYSAQVLGATDFMFWNLQKRSRQSQLENKRRYQSHCSNSSPPRLGLGDPRDSAGNLLHSLNLSFLTQKMGLLLSVNDPTALIKRQRLSSWVPHTFSLTSGGRTVRFQRLQAPSAPA